MTEELPEGAEIITEQEANEIENVTLAEIPEQTKETQSKADLIRGEAKKFVASGANVQDKQTFNAESKRISELFDADYSQVQRLLKKECKIKPENEVSTVQADKNTIKISNKEPLKKPLKKTNEQEYLNEAKNKLVRTGAADDGVTMELKLEAEMIAMSLQALADFEGALGLPSPQQKKIEKMSLMIATYNRHQMQSGHPEKIMKVSERVAELMLKLGIVSMFVLPVVKKYFPQAKDNKGKTQKVRESMR